ncbi:ABC transporter ATP-binding protein [Anaerosalibacter massiliensis]|uniref:ABC transporter ATP-binding protein n=1 Tax=Anaerosalibacter massiliensis TaxID=1347392 RepID=UPI0005B2DF85|nr:ABC transporter ATP-binding protein [Anaerosalibacter massiliensis]
MEKILDIKDLKTYFYIDDKVVHAVDGVSFSINMGEIVSIIGESGSGKSVTAYSIMGIIPKPYGKIKSGRILFKGEDLLQKSEKELTKIRGNKISIVYQEPMNSLNPRLKIGYQLMECLMIHKKMKRKEARKNAIEMLKIVNIPDPEKRYNSYPYELSGGMIQKVMIAMALICKPDLLILDEATTALDVTTQAEILSLVEELKQKYNMSILLITHDLGIVNQIADRVIVMYGGKVLESLPINEITKEVLHPYTIGLMKCIPKIEEKKDVLYSIKGYIPDLNSRFELCPFHERCEKKVEICDNYMPKLVEIKKDHLVRCLLYSEEVEKNYGNASN